ncbi:unnamed protein product [Alopecurus aequalis]
MSTTSSEITVVREWSPDVRHLQDVQHPPIPTTKFMLFLMCIVSVALQYVCALEMSIIVPHLQKLGVPHKYASMVWIGGPLMGIFVNPTVGYYSDRCAMRLGRRRPFIILQCLVICISVMIIAFSTDIGRLLGETMENRRVATVLCIIGVLIIDCTVHTAQGTVRAMMSDFSAVSHGLDVGQSTFVVWVSIGNVLGNLEAAYGKWNRWLPFLKTMACCEACADLKGTSITVVIFMLITTIMTVMLANEQQISNDEVDTSSTQTSGGFTAFMNILKSLRDTKPEMRKLLALTAITWLSWFPFLQYCTDWMGREIYHGKPNRTAYEITMYNTGVREGAFGLILTSFPFGVTSFLIPTLCRKLTSKVIWTASLISMFLIMVGMVSIGIVSTNGDIPSPSTSSIIVGPDTKTKVFVLTLFAMTGIPQAVLYNVPWSVAAELAAEDGGGQGATVGVMTFVIFLSQLIVGLTAGPIDGVFHQGNAPAFGIGGIIALVCAVLVVTMLPRAGNPNGVEDTNGVAAARSEEA